MTLLPIDGLTLTLQRTSLHFLQTSYQTHWRLGQLLRYSQTVKAIPLTIELWSRTSVHTSSLHPHQGAIRRSRDRNANEIQLMEEI